MLTTYLNLIITFRSNPDSLDFAHADVVVTPVVKPGGFRVRMPGHALRDFGVPGVRKVVRNARGAEGVE
jgi:hypothetical protein